MSIPGSFVSMGWCVRWERSQLPPFVPPLLCVTQLMHTLAVYVLPFPWYKISALQTYDLEVHTAVHVQHSVPIPVLIPALKWTPVRAPWITIVHIPWKCPLYSATCRYLYLTVDTLCSTLSSLHHGYPPLVMDGMDRYPSSPYHGTPLYSPHTMNTLCIPTPWLPFACTPSSPHHGNQYAHTPLARTMVTMYTPHHGYYNAPPL